MYIPKQKANKKNNNLVITPCESLEYKKTLPLPKTHHRKQLLQ